MKISISGDICVNRHLDRFAISDDIINIYSGCDYNIACLEAPIVQREDAEGYIKIGPTLKQDIGSVDKIITYFSHLSLANNHSMDYGEEGLVDTISYLDGKNIKAIGAGGTYPNMYMPSTIEKDGIKIALFCWSEAQYGCCKNQEMKAGYAWMLNPITYGLIQEYKRKCDYVILFLHAGLEDVEYPIMEWREQYKAFIDYGADLIIANHPHAIQGKEIYKGKEIYYSLGNLFFIGEYANESELWTNSIILECNISKNRINTIEHFSHFSIDTIEKSDNHIEQKFKRLSEMLLPERKEEFKTIHDRMIFKCWNDYYKYYYSYPIYRKKPKVAIYRRWFNKLMKNYVHRCFLPPVSENKIYHNINIDTHRFVVSRVCSTIAKTY